MCVQLPTVLYIANKIYREFKVIPTQSGSSVTFILEAKNSSTSGSQESKDELTGQVDSIALQRSEWAIFERGSFERQRWNQQWNIIEKVRKKYMYYWTNLFNSLQSVVVDKFRS